MHCLRPQLHYSGNGLPEPSASSQQGQLLEMDAGVCSTSQLLFFLSCICVVQDTTSHFVAQGLSLETCLSRTCSEPELVEGVACARCSLKATLRAAADAPAEAATASGRLQRIEACSAPADLSPAQDAVGDRADQPGGGPVRRRPGPLPDAEDLEALAKSAGVLVCKGSIAMIPQGAHHINVQIAGLQWVVQRTRVARTAPISRPPKVQNCFFTAAVKLLIQRLTILQSGHVQVLALHLKRGVWTNGGQFLKLSGRVSFTEQLDLLPFTSAAPNSSILLPHVAGKQPAFKPAVNRGEGPALQATGSEPPSCLYSLAAVIVHAGHSNSGHYHLYRRIWEEQLQARPGKLTKSRAVAPEGNGGTNTPSSWLSVSDQSVRPADVLEVLACEATLLLYEKQDTCEF